MIGFLPIVNLRDCTFAIKQNCRTLLGGNTRIRVLRSLKLLRHIPKERTKSKNCQFAMSLDDLPDNKTDSSMDIGLDQVALLEVNLDRLHQNRIVSLH